ncbi:MAG: serine/threonine protein kinase [Polyangiaceae bacterium]|nr:serine/threonine protein kinase [Polyangiaceae bacterium]
MLDADWLGERFPELSNISLIGEGGQKWVYAASHQEDGPVVLKLIKPNQKSERVSREVRAVQQVNSGRVPRVLETGSVDTPEGHCIWLREQQIPGETVRSLLTTGPFLKSEASLLALHVLEALADVEQARIVHRDVKPDNVMRDWGGSFWLLDFGIARHLDLTSLTATAAIGGPGTLGYAPPEQFRNRKADIDVRADLFALGVTLWECIAGKHPYRDKARDAQDVIRRIENDPVPRLLIAGDEKNQLSDFIFTLMQRRPDHRPVDATDALSWIREIRAAESR